VILSSHPCLPLLSEEYQQQRVPLLHRRYFRFAANTHPSATSRLRSISGVPGYKTYLAPMISPGRGGFLQCLVMSLSPCCRYSPAEWYGRFSQIPSSHAVFTIGQLSTSRVGHFDAPLRSFRYGPDDSNHLSVALSIGSDIGFPDPAIQTTGLWLYPGRTVSAEHTSLPLPTSYVNSPSYGSIIPPPN